MTKDEMVQRLYIRYLTEESSCSPRNARDALSLAIEETDYFFKNYKPKKKREVESVSRTAVLSVACSDKPWDIRIAKEDFELFKQILNALKAGKSVRMK